ncbi:hypothetical protein EPN87_04125 [archaeon]|nr:MAG: hypothetical protein EPN87_04125 [archaeon]
MRYSESRHEIKGLEELAKQEGLSGKIIGGKYIRNGRMENLLPIDDIDRLALEEDVAVYRTPNRFTRVGAIDTELLRSSRVPNTSIILEIYSRLKEGEILVLDISYGKKPRLLGVSIGKRERYIHRALPYV